VENCIFLQVKGKRMKVFLIAVLMMQAMSVLAQTEVPDTGANASMLKTPEMVPQMSYSTTETLLPYASSSSTQANKVCANDGYVDTRLQTTRCVRPLERGCTRRDR
jgi:hypothetical protein